jgi:hypothetical protein
MEGEKGGGQKFDTEYWGTVGVAMMDKNALFHDSERIDDIGTASAMSYFDLFGTHHDRADPGSCSFKHSSGWAGWVPVLFWRRSVARGGGGGDSEGVIVMWRFGGVLGVLWVVCGEQR